MADDKKVPRLTQTRVDVDKINEGLVDITTKLSNLVKLGDAFTIGGSEAKLEKKFSIIAKISEDLAKNLRKIDDANKKGFKSIENGTRNVQRMEQKFAIIQDKMTKTRNKASKAFKDLELDLLNVTHAMEDEKRAMADVNEELASMDTMAGAVAKTIGNKLLQSFDDLGNALMALGIDALAKSISLIHTGITKIYDLISRTVKAVGEFNKSLGATTDNLSQLQKEGWEVEGALRGLSDADIGVGLQELAQATHAFGFIDSDLTKFRTTAVMAGQALGIGSEQAGSLARSFKLMGVEQDKIATSFMDISAAAKVAGVPVSDFGKEIIGVKGFMVSFGKASQKIFLDSASYAKKFGMSLQSLQQFTELTDSFEKTAEMSAKMNTVFGTSVNALDMMLEKNPAKRVESLRTSLLKQGKDIDHMSRQEVNFLKQTTGLNEEELSGLLKKGMSYDKIMKKREKQQKTEKQNQDAIQQATLKTATTLNNWSMTFDKITKAFMPLLKPFTDFLGITQDIDKATGKVAKGWIPFSARVDQVVKSIKVFFDKLGKNKQVMSLINRLSEDFQDIFKAFTGNEDAVDRIMVTIGSVAGFAEKMYNVGKKIFTEAITPKNIDRVLGLFEFLVNNAGTILSIWGAMKIGGGVANIAKLLPMKGIYDALKSLPGALNLVGVNATSVAATLGKAGLVGAAAAAGWALGRFVGSLEIGGKTIDDYTVDFWEAYVGFYDKMWMWFKSSKLAKFIGIGTTSAEDKGFGEEKMKHMVESLEKGQLFGLKSGYEKVIPEIAQMMQKSEAEVESMVKKAAQATVETKPTVTAMAAPAVEVGAGTNYAAAKAKTATNGNDINLNVELNIDGDKIASAVMKRAAVAHG